MLKKDLCIRCHDESRYRRWADLPSKDRMWDKGRIACVKLLEESCKTVWIPIDGKPPHCCPYIVEHVVSE